jgi:hypothetical protein
MNEEESKPSHRLRRAARWLWVLPMALYQGGGVVGLWRRALRVYRRSGLTGVKTAFEILLRSGGALHRLDYRKWQVRYDTLDETARAAMKRRIGEMKPPPLISVVMPVYSPNGAWLREAIESVRATTHRLRQKRRLS